MTTAEGQRPAADDRRAAIGVFREWDRLDEVVVGRRLDFRIPDDRRSPRGPARRLRRRLD
ncbi:hypothetical protein [Streptodolium elevatio]|uniref:Uncharacterized protein n=1 Tax=Streptodolium elevatio TaxID=3157996 RepID=A0ABV3DQ63_9ACTN